VEKEKDKPENYEERKQKGKIDYIKEEEQIEENIET
jgi:hypothetical protein